MTQQEYDARMTELNNQMHAELAPLSNEMALIIRQKQFYKEQRLQLLQKEQELGTRFYELCAMKKEIKDRYNGQKHEVYLDRPEREE